MTLALNFKCNCNVILTVKLTIAYSLNHLNKLHTYTYTKNAFIQFVIKYIV